jgi:hypothetical protein
MVASLRVGGSVGTGTKEEKSSIGRLWAAGFHHVRARSGLERVLKIMNCVFLQFSKFFVSGWIMNPPIRGSACKYIFRNTIKQNTDQPITTPRVIWQLNLDVSLLLTAVASDQAQNYMHFVC